MEKISLKNNQEPISNRLEAVAKEMQQGKWLSSELQVVYHGRCWRIIRAFLKLLGFKVDRRDSLHVAEKLCLYMEQNRDKLLDPKTINNNRKNFEIILNRILPLKVRNQNDPIGQCYRNIFKRCMALLDPAEVAKQKEASAKLNAQKLEAFRHTAKKREGEEQTRKEPEGLAEQKAVVKARVSLETQRRAVEEERLALEVQRKTLEEERVALERQRKAMEENRVALEAQRIAEEEKKREALETGPLAMTEAAVILQTEYNVLVEECTALKANVKAMIEKYLVLEARYKAVEEERTALKAQLLEIQRKAAEEAKRGQKETEPHAQQPAGVMASGTQKNKEGEKPKAESLSSEMSKSQKKRLRKKGQATLEKTEKKNSA
ncbi:hypothetical protein [Parachlamydia sp. AcF125]|uniref:hypothetical protein n=1 Tax=Parachlamydia sp. AcF125 TaxID=2795736 RepID=UPI001BC8EBCF|nr:hypothetical protein [Parachlamydia sp. AcF125]MBS4167553.1 hypothetical protein [Parachlamydia sp. AcF125]